MGVLLVTGGTRSGKSAVAEALLSGRDEVAYLATGSATDREMTERIAAHRRRRPAPWATVEVLDDPAAALAAAGARDVLLDGFGAWIAGALHRAGAFEPGADLERVAAGVRAKTSAFVAAAAAREATTVVVVEEAGSAPVAADRVTRRWVDLLGEAAQALSEVAERALLVVAGRVVDLQPVAPSPSGAESPAAPAPARDHEPAPGPAGERDRRPGCAPASDDPDPARVPERRPHGDRMVPPGHLDFAVNVIEGPPPEWLTRALSDALDARLGAYPDERPATAAVAARHGRSEGQALLLNGAAEAFWLLAAALRPRRPVVVAPAFAEGAAALRAHGHAVEHVFRDNGWALEPAAVPADADLVLLANPCNPTGTLHPAPAVASLARPGRTLVVDEAFMDLVPGEPESLADREDLPGLVVLRSLTKSLAIPGLRAGYLLADPRTVAALAARRQAWPVNALALAALEAWARREKPLGDLPREVAARRERLGEALGALPGVSVHPGAANFLLVRVHDGGPVVAALSERGIAVRPTADLGLGADFIRVAVRSDDANHALVTALADHLESRHLEPTR